MKPKPGTDWGERTVIAAYDDGRVLFGKREGCTRNCGAYLTTAEEWKEYIESLCEPVGV